jgi:hypothetical protein
MRAEALVTLRKFNPVQEIDFGRRFASRSKRPLSMVC